MECVFRIVYVGLMNYRWIALVFFVSCLFGGCSDESNFKAEIAEGVVLVDFGAPWCGPCKMQAPILEEVAKSVEGYGKVVKLNVDEEPDVARKYGIRSIPTLIIFKDGRVHKKFQGVTDATTLAAAVKAAG